MGVALDNALRAINDAVGPQATEQQQLIAAKCRGLLRGYHERWKDAGYVPLAVEQMLGAPLMNPETQRQSRTFGIAGKLDVIAEYGGRRYVIDHKTTSSDITDPNGTYWRQLVIEGQPSHYMLLMWQNGDKADGAVWDVVRKPGIKPKELTKAELAVAVSSGRYCNGHLSGEDRIELSQGRKRETLGMYELRLADDCTSQRPKWYFERRPLPRLDKDLLEYAQELWDEGQRLMHTRQMTKDSGRLPPRHSGACMLYNSPCNFLGICSGFDQPDSGRWNLKSQVHNELPLLEGDGKDTLTNSRVRSFQACPRKHYYQYELGIERLDEEEREALYTGTLFHTGLNAWWTSQMPETLLESDDGNRDETVTATPAAAGE